MRTYVQFTISHNDSQEYLHKQDEMYGNKFQRKGIEGFNLDYSKP
jgi:hypothetical protein